MIPYFQKLKETFSETLSTTTKVSDTAAKVTNAATTAAGVSKEAAKNALNATGEAVKNAAHATINAAQTTAPAVAPTVLGGVGRVAGAVYGAPVMRFVGETVARNGLNFLYGAPQGFFAGIARNATVRCATETAGQFGWAYGGAAGGLLGLTVGYGVNKLVNAGAKYVHDKRYLSGVKAEGEKQEVQTFEINNNGEIELGAEKDILVCDSDEVSAKATLGFKL